MLEDSRADSVEYLELCDKYFIGWTAGTRSPLRFGRCITDIRRMSYTPAGRKTRLRVAFLMGLPAKNAFEFTFVKSNKTYSASDFAFQLVFGRNMIRWEQIFM